MNDGGGESAKQSEHRSGVTTKKRSGVNEFSHAIARIAVAQICEGMGFQSFQNSALDALSDVAVRYIRDLGKTANLYANLAGRNQCNVFDIIEGLEDLSSAQGYTGASDVNHSLSSSGTIGEVIRHVDEVDENPFAFPVPKFPVVKDLKLNPSFVQTGECPPAHVPAWLPVFPDPESYSSLNSGEKKETNDGINKVEQVGELNNDGKPLLNPRRHLTGSGLEISVPVGRGNSSKAKRVVECNPFVAAPLQSGEKEVSQVFLPVGLSGYALMQPQDHSARENHISALETFTPEIEAVKSNQADPEDGRKKILFNKRTPVQFRLGSSRKSLCRAVKLCNEDHEDIESQLGGENGKDDRKRRAEQILKKTEYDLQDLAHL